MLCFELYGFFTSETESEPAENSVRLADHEGQAPRYRQEKELSLAGKTPGVQRGKGDFLLSQRCDLGSGDDPGSTMSLSDAAGPSWSLALKEQLQGN